MLRGLAQALIQNGQITTSPAKAKELRPFIERLITKSKTGTIAARRSVASHLGEPPAQVVSTLFESIAPQYQSRPGGYTRIIKIGRDSAGRDQAVIELV